MDRNIRRSNKQIGKKRARKVKLNRKLTILSLQYRVSDPNTLTTTIPSSVGYGISLSIPCSHTALFRVLGNPSYKLGKIKSNSDGLIPLGPVCLPDKQFRIGFRILWALLSFICCGKTKRDIITLRTPYTAKGQDIIYLVCVVFHIRSGGI